MTGAHAGHPGTCVLCGSRLKRNGTTSAGTTRWRCTSCGASSTKKRPDLVRRSQLDTFLAWLLGPTPQHSRGPSAARHFRRHHTWCWNITPVLPITGEVYDQVQLDGIYLKHHWCCLIASTGGRVIAWQWCDREKAAAWTALLERIPAPRVVITDGGSGLLSALKRCWPTTVQQRCTVHVQRTVRNHLTTHPRTDAGKALWGLGKALTSITTPDQAAAWMGKLHDWYSLYGHLTKERTYARDATYLPSWAAAGRKWWYTHERLRKAYRALKARIDDHTLFAYLREDLAALRVAATTNQIEGGINAPLREVLRRHRGMASAHQRRAIEWWLTTHGVVPVDPHTLIRDEHWKPQPKKHQGEEQDGPDGPTGYDTAFDPQDGNGIQQGWGGRSHRPK